MKPGDLVQHTLFNPSGSGGYGLIIASTKLPGFWNVQWAGYEDEMSGIKGNAYEVHENDIVVVSGKKLTD
jgi:hypothetical protein